MKNKRDEEHYRWLKSHKETHSFILSKLHVCVPVCNIFKWNYDTWDENSTPKSQRLPNKKLYSQARGKFCLRCCLKGFKRPLQNQYRLLLLCLGTSQNLKVSLDYEDTAHFGDMTWWNPAVISQEASSLRSLVVSEGAMQADTEVCSPELDANLWRKSSTWRL